MADHAPDRLDAVVSATECTGAVPAIPWEGDTEASRRLLRMLPQSGKIYRKKR